MMLEFILFIVAVGILFVFVMDMSRGDCSPAFPWRNPDRPKPNHLKGLVAGRSMNESGILFTHKGHYIHGEKRIKGRNFEFFCELDGPSDDELDYAFHVIRHAFIRAEESFGDSEGNIPGS